MCVSIIGHQIVVTIRLILYIYINLVNSQDEMHSNNPTFLPPNLCLMFLWCVL